MGYGSRRFACNWATIRGALLLLPMAAMAAEDITEGLRGQWHVITFATRRKRWRPASKVVLAVLCTSWKTLAASLSISSEMSALMIWCSLDV